MDLLLTRRLFLLAPSKPPTFPTLTVTPMLPRCPYPANGTAAGTGIVWATYSFNGGSDGPAYPGILRAFDASNVTKELWNSNQNQTRDYSGSWAKWNAPTIANGKVYVATFDGVLNVFGLRPTGGGGSVSGVGDSSQSGSNRTTEGSSDWVHWGDATLNRRQPPR